MDNLHTDYIKYTRGEWKVVRRADGWRVPAITCITEGLGGQRMKAIIAVDVSEPDLPIILHARELYDLARKYAAQGHEDAQAIINCIHRKYPN